MSLTLPQRFQVGPRMSETVVHNGVAYLAGQVANDVTKDIGGQTAEVLEIIDRLLAEAGTDKKRLLMVQIFIADLDDFAGMNAIWDAWVQPGHTPARATVQARLTNPAYRLEIVASAAV